MRKVPKFDYAKVEALQAEAAARSARVNVAKFDTRRKKSTLIKRHKQQWITSWETVSADEIALTEDIYHVSGFYLEISIILNLILNGI